MKYAYSNREIYGITSSVIKTQWRYGVDETIPFDLFEKIKTISGRNDKIEYIKKALNLKKKEVIEYVLRALDKDLNIGINRKLINRAFEKELVPDFGCMLAFKQDEKRFNNTFINLEWCYYNVKVDGIRAIVQVHSADKIEFFSRDGKELKAFWLRILKKK